MGVFPIELPALDERKVDIPLLAQHFLTHLSRKTGKPVPRLTVDNVQDLLGYDGPRNIRELQHVLERPMISSGGGKLQLNLPHQKNSNALRSGLLSTPAHGSADEVLTAAEIREFEAANIRRALAQTGGKIYRAGGAAELIDI